MVGGNFFVGIVRERLWIRDYLKKGYTENLSNGLTAQVDFQPVRIITTNVYTDIVIHNRVFTPGSDVPQKPFIGSCFLNHLEKVPSAWRALQ